MKDSKPIRKGRLKTSKQEALRGMVEACPEKVERVLGNKKLSIVAAAELCDVSRTWIYKMKSGEAVRRTQLEEFCQCLDIPIENLLPDQPDATEHGGWSLVPPPSWEIAEYIGPFREAVNGLSYRVTRLTHKFVKGKQARGKFYDLLHISPDQQQQLTHYLTRHAQVCTLIGNHPNISENLDVVPVDNGKGWWIIDPWVNGAYLDKLIKDSRLLVDADVIRTIGSGILTGLAALHQSEVIFRELSPEKVWVAEERHNVVLTEFELAKLLGGEPSVSESWDYGYFRAPEISNHDAYPQSDFFSWAKIIQWLMVGGKTHDPLPPNSDLLPPKVNKMLEQCLSIRPSKRPANADTILKIWNQWR